MRTSRDGIDLIAAFEGCRLTAYQDDAGVWTIGYGNTGAEARPGNTISQARAEELLYGDLRTAEISVTRRIVAHRPLTQGQFDALVSFEFNTGAIAGDTTIARKLIAGRDDEVDDEMRRWVWVTNPRTKRKRKLTGLIRRRNAEAAMWNDATLVLPREGTINPAESNVVPDIVERETPAKDLGVQGATLAGIAAAVNEGLDHLAPLASMSDTIQIALVALVLAGIALAVYGAARR